MTDVVAMPTRRWTQREDFGQLFSATYSEMVRTVWFVVHDQGVAEEVTQDAFTELYRRWDRLRDYDRPDLWVRRVAIRKAQREASRRGHRRLLEQAAAGPTDADAGMHFTDPQLVAAIASLPPQQRAIVVLFYLEDRPMQEVASLVGCSSATGYVQLHRARKQLARLLGEEVGDHVD